MLDFHDLWHWMAALKTSLPFAIALPILIATVFATIVDWLEHHLATPQETASQDQTDDPSASARRRATSSRSPIFEGERGRNG